jgi:hypothetical protein
MRKLLYILAVVCLVTSAYAQQAALLTGQSPRTLALPSGWTLTATEDFESGNCGTGWCGGNFSTTQAHNDGDATHTHAIERQFGNDDCGGCVFGYNKFLPVGTREAYISFYEWLDSSFRMNDEMFLARFHWDTGNGQPSFRESVFDYFQNSSLAYNSTNATLLWNIQGAPYYQNKLPSNTRGDTTNFSFTTGSWVQHEIYVKFSTFSAPIPITATVTLNASARTYTRSAGSWIADGLHVGDSPHFTGFSNNANNSDGTAGGGGYSVFVTSLTDTVMTVDSEAVYLSNDSAVNPTLQIDYADGSYAYYKAGSLVGWQANMVNPGKVDFATANTTVSLGETYSKLIWRAAVNGNCETQSTGVYTGACSSNISGCGFEQLPLGWNGSGLTRSISGGTFNTHIDCDATWGGPMPTPPVFKRYIDDVIILTKPNVASTPTIPAASVAASTDSCGHYQTISFPGFAKFKVGDGLLGTSCGMAGTSGQGVIGYWDLKNDPTALWDFGASDTGMFEHQWGLKNADTTTRYNEIKEGPMAITVTESNNVRVKLTQSGAVRSVGLLSNTADCCITMTKTYVFYRHGNSAGKGASKVYTQTTLNYDGTDGKGPLSSVGTGTGVNVYNKIGWAKVSGEVNNQTNQIGPCFGSSGLVPFTASPWNMVYKTPGTNANKDYILLAPVAANSATSGEFLQANTCVSPGGSPQGPTVGLIHTCGTPSSSGCVSQSDSAAIVRTNFLQVEQEQQGNYMSLASLAPYFGGGLRIYMALANVTLATNTPQSWRSVGFLGDNNLVSTGAADAYSSEYKAPATITFVTGSAASFNSAEGYWLMTASGNAVSFSANAVLHSPVLNISAFSSAVPTNITVGGSTKVLNIDYVGVKTDSTHLLLQYLSDVSSGSSINIAGAAGTTVTISPKTATIPVLGSQQFSAAGATFSKNSGCLGSVDSASGVYTATSTAETCTITATLGTLTDFATVTASAFTVSPTTVNLNVGGVQQFAANFAATWTATGGTIDTAGKYTAPNLNGTYTITATAVNGGKTATATVTVTGQLTLLPLQTSPAKWTTTAQINASTTQAFTVSNVGTGSVTPTVALSGSSTFTIQTNTCSGALTGGSTCIVTLRFLSAAIGQFNGSLKVTDTASGSQTMLLTGTATGTGSFLISPATATIPVSSSIQLTANQPAYYTTDSGFIDWNGLFVAPATPQTSTVTATKHIPIIANLQTQSNWLTCGNCGDSGGPNPRPTGTFIFTPGDPATFSAQGNYPYNNNFWYYRLGAAGDFNSTTDYMLSFDLQFPTQADKNASQAVEWELQQNTNDQQYSMAGQLAFKDGNKLRIFNKTGHFWEDTGVVFDPNMFAGGKWVTVLMTFHLTIGAPGSQGNTRHLTVSFNGQNHILNIDHASTPAVESDYLHPAFQLDSNGLDPPTPYRVLVRNFNVSTYTGTTTTAAITSINTNRVSPATVSLPTSGVQVFNSQVSSNWTVSCGTFTGTGTTISYTAPASANTCNLAAVGGGVTGTAVATVTALAVTPLSVTLQTNAKQTFTANFASTWDVISGTCTITSAGVLTAPTTNSSCVVRATAQNGGSTATAAVSVVGAPSSSPGSMIVGGTLTGGSIK